MRSVTLLLAFLSIPNLNLHSAFSRLNYSQPWTWHPLINLSPPRPLNPGPIRPAALPCWAVCCVGACLTDWVCFWWSSAWPGVCCCFTTPSHNHGARAAQSSANRSSSSAIAMSKSLARRTRTLQDPMAPPWQDMVRIYYSIHCLIPLRRF